MAAARRLLVPEVVQTSAMDCGPASLKCLLEGFGVHASYGRLREACQTDVDGTSIDTIEEVAVRLGLDAEQLLLPPDHLLLDEVAALPALVVVRRPQGAAHFVIVWRRHGTLVQVMDPAMGRRWLSADALLGELYRHEMPVPAAAWRDWAASPEALTALRRRLRALAVPAEAVEALCRGALRDPGWRGLGALDAAARMAADLVAAGALGRGEACAALVQRLAEQAAEPAGGEPVIPDLYWSVRRPVRVVNGEDGEEQVLARGAVLVRVRGPRADGPGEDAAAEPLPPALQASLTEPPSRPMRDLLRLLRRDGLLRPAALLGASLVAALGVVIEALLLRGLVDVGRDLGLIGQRLSALGGLLVLVVALLLLEVPIQAGLLRIGRRLDVRLRLALLQKLPRLGDRYIHSRLSSDMAERSHSAHALRALPARAGSVLRLGATLLFTTLAVVWIDPSPAYLLLVAASLLLPLCAQPLLVERDLRVRSHAGALSRFYLDALVGLVAIKNHGAERTIRREHDELLDEWVAASRSWLRGVVAIESLQSLLGAGLAVWLVLGHVARSSEDGSLLLLVYFTLQLPALGQEIALELRQYPTYRNLALRLTEPLGAPEEEVGPAAADAAKDGDAPAPGVSAAATIRMEGVTVACSGHVVLEGVDLDVAAGSHVAIVGLSGAGKSTLVGLLLGFHRPAGGRVLVDGAALDGAGLARLRRATAWVDPAVQLWNRPLLDNLRYGAPAGGEPPLLQVIEQAQLLDVLRALPDGLSTPLGDGGALVSGGEGQRVRLGRAMLRPAARLVVLDEPFRGLDRDARRELLGRARRLWRGATLLCVTHDVGETLAFDRVLVVEQGRIREDGDPRALAEEGSRYRELLDAERAVRERLWSGAGWRRLTLRDGRLSEEPPEDLTGEPPEDPMEAPRDG